MHTFVHVCVNVSRGDSAGIYSIERAYQVYSSHHALRIKQEVLVRTNCLLSFDTKRTAKKTTPKKLLVAARRYLPSCSLETVR
jgi:hypothetical protein